MSKGNPLLFIDFEFTMPEHQNQKRSFFPEIIEVGVVAVNQKEITHQYSTFVQPNFFPILSRRCKNFLKIEQKQVDEGITFKQLLLKLNELDEGKDSTIITWGNMDMKVLKQSCEKHQVSFPFKGEEIDLSMEYKKFFGNQNQTGLWKAVEEYGKSGTGKHHRALDDALTTFNIYQLIEKDKSYLDKHEPTTIGDLIDLSKLFPD